MQLKHAILGYLSWQSLTGYELKKLFAQSDFLPWSGNNNQIYKTLVNLYNDALISKEVIEQENLPTQKRYAITDAGRTELKNALTSAPNSFDIKHLFLVQLAWADYLSPSELNSIIAHYQYQIELKLKMSMEKLKRKEGFPERTSREAFLWQMIAQNHISHYQTELNWLVKLRNGLENRV